MDVNQPDSCFVCNKDVLGKGVLLSMETTLYSNTPFLTKIMQLLGEEFMVVILEDNKICVRCVNLINRTDKLEQDLRKTQSIIRSFINEKYNLNEEVGFSSLSEELEGTIDNYIYDEESLLHSPTTNVHCPHDEGYKLNKYLKNKEELFEKYAISENACDIRIKSEPVLNSEQYLNSNESQKICGNCDHTISEALLKKLPEDNVAFKKKHSTLGSSWSEVNKIVQEFQDAAVCNLKKETVAIENNVPTAPHHASNDHSPRNELSEKSVAVPTEENSDEKQSEINCDVFNSNKEVKYILTSNNIHNVESSKEIAGEVSEAELSNTASEKELSEKSKVKSRSSNLNKQNNHKRVRKEKTENTIRKLRPILPKISNIKEVLSSLYIVQHSDSSVGNEILNEHPKYNVSIKSESSVINNSEEIMSTKRDGESNPNKCTLTEAKQLNLMTKTPLTGDLSTHCEIKAFKSREKEHLQVRYKCSFCPKSFKRKASVKDHEVLHTGNYAHYCEFCGQGFVSLHKLEYHRRSHTKEESYMCDVCGKKFHFQGTYWIHRKWHDNPFPYKCDDCGRPFKHSSRLSIHRRKHRGERPYKCSYCPLTFDVSQTLKRHLVLHTKQFPYKCGVCDQGFTTRSKYTDHMARKHNTFLEKPSVDPKDYKMAVYNDVKEKTRVDSTSAQKLIDFGESNCHFENSEISENSDLIFHNNTSDCHIEIILPPSSMSDNSFSNISWLT